MPLSASPLFMTSDLDCFVRRAASRNNKKIKKHWVRSISELCGKEINYRSIQLAYALPDGERLKILDEQIHNKKKMDHPEKENRIHSNDVPISEISIIPTIYVGSGKFIPPRKYARDNTTEDGDDKASLNQLIRKRREMWDVVKETATASAHCDVAKLLSQSGMRPDSAYWPQAIPKSESIPT